MSILITPSHTDPAWQTTPRGKDKDDAQAGDAWPRPPRRTLTPNPAPPEEEPPDSLDVDERTRQQAMSDALDQARRMEDTALRLAALRQADPRRRFRPPDGQEKWTKQALMHHIKQQAAARWREQQDGHAQPSPTWVDRPLWEQADDDTQGENQ